MYGSCHGACAAREDPVISSAAAKMQQEVGRSMLMLQVLERQEFIIDIVGLLAFSARLTPEQQQEMQNLVEQTTFILDSIQVR